MTAGWGRGLDKTFCVYMMASRLGGTIYIGVTSRLMQRVWEHREGIVEGFTRRYGVHLLVWYEVHETAESAIVREKQLKAWKRSWKIELIEKTNPNWDDLYPTLSV
jgi:putative endonuclease